MLFLNSFTVQKSLNNDYYCIYILLGMNLCFELENYIVVEAKRVPMYFLVQS